MKNLVIFALLLIAPNIAVAQESGMPDTVRHARTGGARQSATVS